MRLQEWIPDPRRFEGYDIIIEALQKDVKLIPFKKNPFSFSSKTIVGKLINIQNEGVNPPTNRILKIIQLWNKNQEMLTLESMKEREHERDVCKRRFEG